MRLRCHPQFGIRIFCNIHRKSIQNNNVQTINQLLVLINEMAFHFIHLNINSAVCFLAVFNPTKSQIRTKIIKHRGFTPRTDKVPLQVPENLKIVQDELKGEQSVANNRLIRTATSNRLNDYFFRNSGKSTRK